jgi:hypothetical protein
MVYFCDVDDVDDVVVVDDVDDVVDVVKDFHLKIEIPIFIYSLHSHPLALNSIRLKYEGLTFPC